MIEILAGTFVLLTLQLVAFLLIHFFGFWGMIAFLVSLILIIGYAIHYLANN